MNDLPWKLSYHWNFGHNSWNKILDDQWKGQSITTMKFDQAPHIKALGKERRENKRKQIEFFYPEWQKEGILLLLGLGLNFQFSLCMAAIESFTASVWFSLIFSFFEIIQYVHTY